MCRTVAGGDRFLPVDPPLMTSTSPSDSAAGPTNPELRESRHWLRIAGLAVVLAACAHQVARPEPGSRGLGPLREISKDRRSGHEIAVAGRFFDIGTPVVLWADEGGYDAYDESPGTGGMGSEPPSGKRYGVRRGLRSRTVDDLRTRVRQFVLHYDVAVVSRRCFDVLHERRGLSVHFMLDADGTIYQTLDIAERAWHASSANDDSVGVEIAHIGAYPSPGHPEVQKVYSRDHLGWYLDLPEWIGASGFRNPGFVARPRTDGFHAADIHGRRVHQLDYTPEQYEALAHLVAGLHRVLDLPIDYPRGSDGGLLRSQLSATELDSFEGVLGHWHVQSNKVDPGPAMDWDHLRSRSIELR